MNVVHVVPALAIGGAERIATLVALGLVRLGHTVAVVSLGGPTGSWLEAELLAENVSLHFLGKRAGLDVRMVARLGRLLADLQPDVIHTHLHTLKYVLPTLVTGRRCGVVHTLHNLAEYEASRFERVFQGMAFRRGVVPVAVGHAVAASIRRVYGIPVRYSIPNGIPVAEHRASHGARKELRAELGIPHDAPTFLTVGRLCTQKNHAVLLQSFCSPRLRAMGARLLIVGDGELRDDLRQQVSQTGMGDRVHFLGIRKDIPHLAAAADVFVLSSLWEGNPLVVMEAMAAGLPVVATAVGSVPEIVSEATGRLVAPADESALSAALEAFGSDLSLARKLGAAGASMAPGRFDASAMVRAYEDLYAELVPAASLPAASRRAASARDAR